MADDAPAYAALFREMTADKKCPCPYCEEGIEPGDQIIGHYGVRWGHVTCVHDAYERSVLILSKANSERRPAELEIRSTGSTAKPKRKPAPAWSDDWMGKPASCEYFPAQRLKVLSLPEELHLNPRVIAEMTATQEVRAMEDIWGAYLQKWLAEYKLSQRELPYCPVHQSQKIYVQLEVAKLGGESLRTQRALWWYCPGIR